MRRRDLLAGAAGLAVVGGGAAYALGGHSPGDAGDEGLQQFELSGIEAPGSAETTVTVPERDRVDFVEVFATSCGVCQDMMPTLASVHEEYGDDVRFVSVTNEPVGHTVDTDYVADWWDRHEGNWQVAHDDDLELTRALSSNTIPHTVLVDEDNRIQWEHTGRSSEDELRAAIEAVL